MGADDVYDEDGWVCEGYPEHDYALRDEADGERVYDCRRCGAELVETADLSTDDHLTGRQWDLAFGGAGSPSEEDSTHG